VFVGDNIYGDVFGAQNAGMRGVLFTPSQRGNAVAPPFEHGREIRPDATCSRLDEIPAMLDRWS